MFGGHKGILDTESQSSGERMLESGGVGERVCESERANSDSAPSNHYSEKVGPGFRTKTSYKMYFSMKNSIPMRKPCSAPRLFEIFSIFEKIFGKIDFSGTVREIRL